MNAPSLPVRAVVFLAGAALAGLVAAGVSTALPDPYPLAAGFAVAVPVMDVALYPQNVPDDPRRALAVGVGAALLGVLAGFAVASAVRALPLSEYAAVGLTAGAVFVAAEYGGRLLAARIPRT
ncbi:hypothetical protein EFA46_006070 [Halarchaeum sp. CBA1220]|uniref:hypothetical protein n=1 Tax=Halarchaeum sp. CBA1220 TaxID=1853682 RepID=UPI000F3A92C1|nr:hypothetical protein [Halarchaeum sp. CBA1220]QLC33779.1 hypothetical protein EFA46_006070 [Halarchaeum sp. CBA1220]